MGDELWPVFVVRVRIDGDDYPKTATEAAMQALELCLEQLRDQKVIRAFELSRDVDA
jgi:hypothetical protein